MANFRNDSHPMTTPAVSPSNVVDGPRFELPPRPVSGVSSIPERSFASGNREASQRNNYEPTRLTVTPTRLEGRTANPTVVASPTAHTPVPFGVLYVRDGNPSAPAGERTHSFQQRSPPHQGMASSEYRQTNPRSSGSSFIPQTPSHQLSSSENLNEMQGLLREMSIPYDPAKISITYQDRSDTSAVNYNVTSRR